MKHTILVLYRTILEREQVLSRMTGMVDAGICTCALHENVQVLPSQLVVCYCPNLVFAYQLKNRIRESKLLLFAPADLASMFSLLNDGRCMTLSLHCTAERIAEIVQYAFHVPVQQPQSVSLTGREMQVIRLLVSGQDNRQIALSLGIKVSTVIAHKKHLFLKSGMHSTSQLVVWALLKQGI